MNIGNITSDNFNLDGNGKDIQIEVYEQLIEQLQQENKILKENNMSMQEEMARTWEKADLYKEVIDKTTNELFILKDMIYKPETREENFEIQRKISSIIKRLNGKEV